MLSHATIGLARRSEVTTLLYHTKALIQINFLVGSVIRISSSLAAIFDGAALILTWSLGRLESDSFGLALRGECDVCIFARIDVCSCRSRIHR